ncbi:MAG: GNAT family N-acetyltransferase, partial [Chloroflexota bacterium]|nr:GNAT family N-acetyltransferase [Chloroflexota bacterium]
VDHLNRSGEFMIVIDASDCRGKGYGTEAARLVLDHAFLAIGLNSVMLRVSEYNRAGVRSYEKAGFKRAGVLRKNKWMGGRLWDTILMDMVAEEFESPVLSDVLREDPQRRE